MKGCRNLRAESAISDACRLFGRRHHASTSSAWKNNNGDDNMHQRQSKKTRWQHPMPMKQTIKKIRSSSSHNKSKETTSKQKQHQHHAPYTKPKSQLFQAPFSAFISCLPGLEPLLLQEVKYLQSHWLSLNDCKASNLRKGHPHILRGGVKLTVPSVDHLYTLHLYMGTASHIYLRLNDDNFEGLPPLFRARGFPELQRKVKDLIISQRWDEWLTGSGHSEKEHSLVNVQVHVTTSKSKLMHTKAIEERLKQTIGELIPNIASGSDESEAATAKTVRLMTRIDRDVVQLSLDTSLVPLHRRGYRLKPHKAPLREDLAYALLMSGGLMPRWDLRPHFSNDSDDSIAAGSLSSSSRGSNRVLFDPFCGSGTIAIEGASLQLGLPPGRFHPPPLECTTFCNPALWEEMKSKAMSVSSTKQDDPVYVAAGDIDAKALDAAKANAKRAGVDDCIDFVKGSFVSHPLLKLQPKNGKKSNVLDATHQSLLVVANPPYGKRLSPDETKKTIYRKLAHVLLSSSSSRSIDCAMIGKDLRVMREAGIPSLDVAFSTKHGGLSVVAMTGSLL